MFNKKKRIENRIWLKKNIEGRGIDGNYLKYDDRTIKVSIVQTRLDVMEMTELLRDIDKKLGWMLKIGVGTVAAFILVKIFS